MASAPNTRRTRHERIDLFLAPMVEKCLGRLTIVAADSRSIDCSLRSLYLTRLQLNLGVRQIHSGISVDETLHNTSCSFTAHALVTH